MCFLCRCAHSWRDKRYYCIFLIQLQGSEEGYLRKTALRSVPSDWGPLHDQEGFNFHPQPQTLCDSTGHEKEEVNTCFTLKHIKITESDILSSTVSALSQQDPAASTGSVFLTAEEDDDGSYIVTNGSSLVLQYEYHILFSCSYGAPVLYFRAFTLG